MAMALTTICGWLLIGIALVAMFPWARLLLPAETDSVMLVVTTLALSFGMLSLSMFWLGLIGARVDWRGGGLLYAAVAALGAGVLIRRGRAGRSASKALLPESWRVFALIALVVTAILAALMLFNALYWPLGVDDALAIYGYYGKLIAFTGALPPLAHGSLYEAYPMAISLGYAFVIQFGQTLQPAMAVNEHLMALIPALLSLGVLPVAYLIGRELFNRTTGIVAALLITLTPTIAYWMSASYADLPAGFFYGLSFYFALRQYRTRRWQDALLSGIMAGLAAWTKNSALLLIGVLVLWIGYCFWQQRQATLLRPMNVRTVIVIGLGFAAVCGPWYARDWLLAGVIVPPTGWTFAAERTTDNLLPYFVDLHYWFTGFVFTLGLCAALWQTFRSRGRAFAPTALLIGYIPFFAIWWALFSYEDRFLLTLTPLIAVMGARAITFAAELISDEDRFLLALRLLRPWLGLATIRRWARRFSVPRLRPSARLTRRFVLVLLLLALLPASNALLFKGDILRRLFMSDADKGRVRFDGLYSMAQYLQTLPAGSRILAGDTRLPFLAFPAAVTVGDATSAADLAHYNYWLFTPGQQVPDWLIGAAADSPITSVYQIDNYRLYAVSALQYSR